MGQEKFQQADALFQQGKYTEARQLLAELNAEFPDTPNILYPLAMCLEKLGHADFALKICDQLIQKHQHPRAQELKTKIESAPPTAAAPAMAAGGMGDLGDLGGIGGTGGVGGMDDLSNLGSVDMNNLDVGGMDMGGMDMSNLGDLGGMDMGNLGDIGGVGGQGGSGMDMAGLGMDLGAPASRPAAARPVASQGRDWSAVIWLGGLFVLYFLGQVAAMKQSLLLLQIVGQFAGTTLIAYLSFKVLNALPEDDVSEDLKHIAITTLICVLLSITIIGFFGIPFVVAKRYDLSFLRTLGCMGLFILIAIGISIVLIPILMVMGLSPFSLGAV